MRYPNSMTIETAKIVPYSGPLSFNVFVLDSGSNNMVTELMEERFVVLDWKEKKAVGNCMKASRAGRR